MIDPMTAALIMQGLQSAYMMYAGKKGAAAGERERETAMRRYKEEQEAYQRELERIIDSMPTESITIETINKIMEAAKSDYTDMYARSVDPKIQSQYQARGMYGSGLMRKAQGTALDKISREITSQRVGLETGKTREDIALKQQKLQARAGAVQAKAGTAGAITQAEIAAAKEKASLGADVYGKGMAGLINLPMQYLMYQSLQGDGGAGGKAPVTAEGSKLDLAGYEGTSKINKYLNFTSQQAPEPGLPLKTAKGGQQDLWTEFLKWKNTKKR